VSSPTAIAIDWPAGGQVATVARRFGMRVVDTRFAVALRPVPWVALGFGLDVPYATVDWVREDGAGGAVRSSTQGAGLGGHVGLLVRAVPRWLTIGLAYTSGVDLTLTGRGALEGPGRPQQLEPAALDWTLPHRLQLGLETRPHPALRIEVDVEWRLWSDLRALVTRLGEPPASGESGPASTDRRVVDVVEVNRRDALSVRLGLEGALLGGRLLARLGGGVDTGAVRRGWLLPLQPESLTGLVTAGLGVRLAWFGADLGYAAALSAERVSTHPSTPVPYRAVTHLIAASVSARLWDAPPRIARPDWKR
jgi:hypothetical protein